MREPVVGLALWLALVGVACRADIPDGVYVCTTSDDCPPGLLCDPDGLCGRDVPCVPLTCAELRAECGSPGDRCGADLDCGTCDAPDTCGGGGIELICGCTPTSCIEAGVSCGMHDPGCGEELVDCGGCAPPATCGGGGVDGQCGCEDPSVCEDRECGDAVDRCGNVVDCGSCPPSTPHCMAGVCGSTPCVPTPDPCTAMSLRCGPVSDGCATVSCGTCTLPETCGGDDEPGQCGCARTTTCAGAGAECGDLPDGCGALMNCGTCSGGQSCDVNTCVCPDDTGNDTLMTATDSGTFPTSPLTLTGTIGAVTDADWYRFRLIGASTDLPYVVRLTGIAPVNNYNLGVYFDCGGEVLVSCAGGSIATEPYSGCLSTAGLGADELVTAMASCSSGTMYIEVSVVRWASGTCDEYQLTVEPG